MHLHNLGRYSGSDPSIRCARSDPDDPRSQDALQHGGRTRQSFFLSTSLSLQRGICIHAVHELVILQDTNCSLRAQRGNDLIELHRSFYATQLQINGVARLPAHLSPRIYTFKSRLRCFRQQTPKNIQIKAQHQISNASDTLTMHPSSRTHPSTAHFAAA